jgi:hypothetical protein
LSREFRPLEAPVALEPSRLAVLTDVPAAALPLRMAAVVLSHQRAAAVSPRRMAAWDATARRRQEEAVAGAYATVRPHRAALMKAVEEPRQVLVTARHAAAPRMQEVETAVVVVASDATAAPQEVAAMAGSGAMELPPVEAVRDAQVERLPVGAAAVRHVEAAAEAVAPHAVVEVEAGAAAQVVVAPRREAAAVARAEVEQRQVVVEEVPAAREAAPAAAPSEAASVFHQGRLRPAPQPAARSVREKRGLRNASRSARSSQAAQDEVWSWRSRFLESLL